MDTNTSINAANDSAKVDKKNYFKKATLIFGMIFVSITPILFIYFYFFNGFGANLRNRGSRNDASAIQVAKLATRFSDERFNYSVKNYDYIDSRLPKNGMPLPIRTFNEHIYEIEVSLPEYNIKELFKVYYIGENYDRITKDDYNLGGKWYEYVDESTYISICESATENRPFENFSFPTISVKHGTQGGDASSFRREDGMRLVRINLSNEVGSRLMLIAWLAAGKFEIVDEIETEEYQSCQIKAPSNSIPREWIDYYRLCKRR